MHRIDSAYKEDDKFGAGKHGFTDGDPGVTPATETTEDWFDGVQEEIISPIEDMGIALVKGTRNQLLSALRKLHAQNNALNMVRCSQVAPKNIDLNAVCSGDNDDTCAVAVGDADGADAYALSSGLQRTLNAWTEYDGGGKNFNLYGVAGDGAGIYVAVGPPDGADSYIVRGTGHAAWAEIANPVNVVLNGVCYGNSIWVAVGESDGADAVIITSADGLAPWTQRGVGTLDDVNLLAVAYDGSGLYVAVGNFDVDAYIVTSSDALTWVERSNSASARLRCVAYGENYCVAAGDAEVLRSPDGITWTDVTPSGFDDAYGAAYGGGVFVLIGHNGGFWVSVDDGANWVQGCINSDTTNDFNDITYSTVARCFVIVGDKDGTEAEIYHSLLNAE